MKKLLLIAVIALSFSSVFASEKETHCSDISAGNGVATTTATADGLDSEAAGVK